MTAAQHLAAAMERAKAIAPEERIPWPADAADPALVAALLAADLANRDAVISKGFVRAKSMPGRPEKPAPTVVT